MANDIITQLNDEAVQGLTIDALDSTSRAEQPPQAFINELCNLGAEACMEPPGQNGRDDC